MPKLSTVFAGSPQFAATILARLATSKFAPKAVYTQPDRPQGRGRKLKANATKTLALALDIPVHQPKSLRTPEAVAELTELAPDVMIVAAYGLILPAEILAIPTYGCINVHASLLPRWRGAAPIERAIMAGDTETGVCIMKMETGLDTGPVYSSRPISIEGDKTTAELEHTLAECGAEDLINVLEVLNEARKGQRPMPEPVPQNDDEATYAEKLNATDRKINWSQSAKEISLQITALASRLPVRVTINECGVQLLVARSIEQNVLADEPVAPGTLIDVSKTGLLVQCATDLLHISSLKVERGKGKVLDPAAAINGFGDIFYPGARLL